MLRLATRINTDASLLLSIFTICIISAADLYFWNSFSLSKSISKEYKTFWSFSLRSINKNKIWIEIKKNLTNLVPPFYRQISLSQDWLEFFWISIQMLFLFKLLREKDQRVLNSYEMLLLSETLFQKYRPAALMIQIVNIDKSEDASMFILVAHFQQPFCLCTWHE